MMKIFLNALFLFTVLNLSAQSVQKEKFKVWGNCKMCQTKIIESASAVDGVKKAHWNINTQEMMVKFDAEQTSLKAIQMKIAEAGYDNDGFRADDEVYENLHYCCKYERKQSLKNK